MLLSDPYFLNLSKTVDKTDFETKMNLNFSNLIQEYYYFILYSLLLFDKLDRYHYFKIVTKFCSKLFKRIMRNLLKTAVRHVMRSKLPSHTDVPRSQTTMHEGVSESGDVSGMGATSRESRRSVQDHDGRPLFRSIFSSIL